MAIGNVGASNPLSSLWMKPHYGLESKFDKYRREHSMEAKQEELAKFQTQTTATMEQSKGEAGGNPYTAVAKTRSLTEQGLSMSMMFEVQRTSIENLEDIKTQIEQNARESQTQQPQDMAASVQASELERELDGTPPDEASGSEASASAADTSKNSVSQSGGNSGETNSANAASSSPTYTSGGTRSASSAAVYGKVNISV